MRSFSCLILFFSPLLATLLAAVANKGVEAFVSTEYSIPRISTRRAALPFFIDADELSHNNDHSTDIVLFGLGDLRVDDHVGLHRALTSPKCNAILPICILDSSSLAQLPGACAHTADSAACIHAGLTELAKELEEKCSLPLQVIVADNSANNIETLLVDCIQQVLDSIDKTQSSEINLHVCDLGPADNQIGYGPFAQLSKIPPSFSQEVNVISWNANLRDQPWQNVAALPVKYTDYSKKFISKNSAVRPLDTPTKNSDVKALHVPMNTGIPSLRELEELLARIVSKRNPLLNQSGRLDAERGSGLFMTHWGGLNAELTVGCQSAKAILDAYVQVCEQDDKAWFSHSLYPGRSKFKRNGQSLEHASMMWQLEGDGSLPAGNAENWMAGESMTRFLAAPLLLGTVSPRRVWQQSTNAARKGLNFAFVPPLERLVEAREWHRLLAAHNMACKPDAYEAKNDGSSVYYRYWRYQGFLCRYAARSLTKDVKSKNTDGILLVHGFGASGAQWNKAMGALAELQRDDSVEFGSGLAPDLLGFGESEKPAISYTGYLWDSQVLDFVKECAIPKHGWESYVVGGNSIGGFTSMSAAACDTARIATNDSQPQRTLVTSSGAPGTGLCEGLILMNSAGPIKTKDEIESEKAAAEAISSEDPRSGATRLSIAQVTAINALPVCSPPPRPVARAFGNGLLLYLRPNIQSICVNLYPANPSAVDDSLCGSIERDSLDPGAICVMMAGAKLPVPRTANELLNSDFRMGLTDASSVHESTFDGPVLVAQGVLDPLNDAQDRLERFGALRQGITMDGIQAGHCPHDELPERVAQSILKWRRDVTNGSLGELSENGVLLSRNRNYNTLSPFDSRNLPSPQFISNENDSLLNSQSVAIAMTREEGKIGKLLKAILEDKILSSTTTPIELPCIAHADGPDMARLEESLRDSSWDYVAVTSPEAARVLARVWDQSTMSSIQVAAVGKATERELVKNGIDVAFTPSKAYAKVLVEELPGKEGTTLLYPASCKAATTLADGLSRRGFQVTRLNTYDTVSAKWSSEQIELGQQCKIVCFASPSSVHGWLQNSGNNTSALAACIGQTSATTCLKLGWDESNIFYPEAPGIGGWVKAIKEAVHKLDSIMAPV